MIALSPGAKATPSASINLYAGGVGEGPGTQIGQIVTQVFATNSKILSSGPSRPVMRELDRASGNQIVVAGNGAVGIANGTVDAKSIALSPSDIERVGNEVYVASLQGIGKLDANGGYTRFLPNSQAFGIAVASDGTVYWSENNLVRRLVPGGSAQTIAGAATAGYADGAGANARFDSVRDIALSPDGNTLYAGQAGAAGGTIANRLIRAINLASPSFDVTTVFGNTDQAASPSCADGPALGAANRGILGLDVLPNGDLLAAGGDDACLRQIHLDAANPANNTTTRIAGGPGQRPPTTSPGSNPLTANMARIYDVSRAPDGTIALGTDTGLFVIESGLIRRVAGNYTRGRGGDGGPATGPLATLLLPRGIATDDAGNTYVGDYLNNAVRKIDQNGIITMIAGLPDAFAGGPVGDGGPGVGAAMTPAGVAVDKQGNVYIADTQNNTVRKLSPDNVITTIAGNGTAGTGGDGGPATSAQLDTPWSIAIDSAGSVYVAELWQSRVRKIFGGNITTIYDKPGTDNPGLGRSSTRSITIGPDDSLYIADQVDGQVKRVPATGGAPQVVAGNGVVNGTAALLGENGPATQASISFPAGIAVDHLNNVYFNDHCSIRKVDHATGVLTTLAGTGVCNLRGIGGPARAANFGTPSGVAILGTDLVFSDESSHRVFSVSDVVPPPAPPEADVVSGKIAYDSADYGGSSNREIAVANPDGTEIRHLASTAGQDTDPEFSHDGSHIAWTSDVTGNFDVWTMNSDGSNHVNLTAGSAASDADPSWSPAGNTIAFTRAVPGPSFDIITKNADGTNEVNLTSSFNNRTAAYPDWFPDGSAVVVQSQDHATGNFDIYRVPVDGSAPVALLSTPADEAEAQVSPDGSKIVYMSNAGGSNDIWIMNADGTNPTRLTSSPGFEFLPTFSADGKYIMYNDNSNALVRIRLDGSNPTPFLVGTGHFAASWVDNLSIDVGAASAVAQPATVEGADVLLQPKAPAISASAGALSLLNIVGSPGALSLLNIIGSPGALSLLNIVGSPGALSLLNIIGSPGALSLLNIVGSPGALSLLNIVGSPGLAAAFDQISLLSIPIAGGWEAFFADGRPIQGRSLLDAAKTGKPIPLLDLTIAGTPLANVSLFSFFVGQMQLRDLADTATEARWCEVLESLDDHFVAAGGSDANDCGAVRFATPGRAGGGLGATLIELQMQGVPLTLFPELAKLTFHDINWDIDSANGNAVDTPFEATRLFYVDLAASDLGALTMGELASAGVRDAIVDCGAAAGICEPSENLAFAQSQGAIRSDALLQKLLPAIGGYNAVLTLVGLLPPQIRPLQALNPDSDVFAAVDEPGVNDVDYSVQFSPVGVPNAREATISVGLPGGFIPVFGSATVSVDGGAPVAVPMKSDGRTMRARLEGVTIPAGTNAVLSFKARPGQTLSGNRRVSAQVTAPGVSQSIGNKAGIAITERFEPENNFADTPTTPILEPDTMYLTHIAEPGDVDYFTLPMNAGDRVRILLDQPKPDVTGGNADLDLAVYAPQGAATAPLRATVDSGEAITPVFDNPNRLGEPVRPDVLQDINLLSKPVVALSTNRGGFNEGVTVLAPVTGNYVVQVSGYNGASSSHPYSLQAAKEIGQPIPSCPSTPRNLPAATTAQRGALPTSVASSVETLILVNQSRLYSLYDDAQVDTLVNRLQTFAANSTVKGAVINVDGSAAVRAAYSAWDADPCSVDLANDVVRKINGAVDGLVDLRAGRIKHMVVVGDDDAIPSARIPDLTQAANERNYADAVRIANGSLSLASALAAGNVLSDDPFGDGAPAPYLGRHLYVSDVGLGRLVESPTEIDGQLTNYLNTFSDASTTNDGRLAKSTAFTAGWDFMKDVATEIDTTLDAFTGAPATTNNQLIGDTWTDTDIKPKFTSAAPAPNIVSLNAHFTHNAFEPPAVRDPLNPAGSRVTTADVDNGTLSGATVFSMGCHSGLNVPDIVVGPADAKTRDWAQSLSAKKATFVGQTGFGYGLQDAIALSEDIMLGFTKNLTTSMTIGQALAFAKHDYLGGLGVYGVYDEKALAQATMYGLPNWKVGTGAIPGTGPSLPLTTDERTGLNVATFDHSDTFTPHTSSNGTYWSGTGGTLVVADRPIQPKSELDVTQANGLIAHGAELTGLTSDEVGANAVFASVVLDDSTRETEVEDPTAVFPAALQRINDFTTPSGERQRLVLMTGQYRALGADADGDVSGAQRFYRRMAGRIQYSTSTDFTSPKILSTDSFEVGNGVSFAAAVDDALGASTIKAVSVLYHAVGNGDSGTDVWTRLPLARDTSDPKRWVATGGPASDGDGDELEYLLVAVDDAGNTSNATRKGALYAAAVPPAAPSGVSAAVVGQPSPSGWYPSANVSLASDDGSTFEYSVDGGEWQAYDGPIPVTGDGTHTVAYRTDDGDTGEVVVPIDTAAPTVTITSPANGATFEQGAVVLADFACADTGAGVASCVGSSADGAPIDTSSTGTKTFSVTATDGAGRTTTQQVTYTVAAAVTFDGWYSPVKNPTTLNKQNSGSSVPMKWRLFKANGQEITDPNSVTSIRSFAINCSSRSRSDSTQETIALGGKTVTYDTTAKQFLFTWKTNKLWVNSCRRLEFTFSGGVTKYADFQFTL